MWLSSSKTHSRKYSIHLAWALGYHWGNCYSDNASILYQILLALPVLYPTMPRNSPEKFACYSDSSSGIQTRTLVCSQVVEVRANSVPFWMPSVTQGQLFLTQTTLLNKLVRPHDSDRCCPHFSAWWSPQSCPLCNWPGLLLMEGELRSFLDAFYVGYILLYDLLLNPFAPHSFWRTFFQQGLPIL